MEKMTDKNSKMENVKGFRDFTELDALKRERIKEIIVQKFKNYGFEPAETPVIEYEKFVKGEGQEDEVISDIFKLRDKGDRKLALRYEFTFQLKRLAKNKKLPYRRYQIGEVFRDEPISATRFRQFTQCDVDVINSTLRDEAEILKLTAEILKELKIKAIIYVNSRKLLNEILEEQNMKQKAEVIKEIDKLGKLSESEIKENLKKYKAEDLLTLFKKPESYFKKYKNYEEIKKLKEYCKDYGVAVKFLPSLARGLSYYNGSIFEIKTKEMKETIIAGGSYLVNGIQSTGISFGLNRLGILADVKTQGIKCLAISINQDKETIKIVEKLRNKNISCFILDKISKALDYANKQAIPYVVFIGEKELKQNKLRLRDMKTGKEKLLSMADAIKELTK